MLKTLGTSLMLGMSAVAGVGVAGAATSSAATSHVYEHRAYAPGYSYSQCVSTRQSIINQAHSIGASYIHAGSCTSIGHGRYSYYSVDYRATHKITPGDLGPMTE